MLNQFRKYNNWANSLLLDTLISNSHSLPESCILLFSHIVNAQTIWGCRIKGIKPSVSVWQLNELITWRELLEESVCALAQLKYIGTADSPIIKYSTSAGDEYETSIAGYFASCF